MIPRHVVPGMSTRPDTRSFGDFADSVQDLRNRQMDATAAASKGTYRNPAIVLGRNTTLLYDFPRYSIVALNRAGISPEEPTTGNFLYDGMGSILRNYSHPYSGEQTWPPDRAVDNLTFLQQPYSVITIPCYEDQSHLGITLEPIDRGHIGQVAVSGVCQARVYVTYEKHMYAHCTERFYHEPPDTGYIGDIYGGQHSLLSGHWGPISIVYKPPGTGLKWCLVQLNAPSMFRRFEMTAALDLPQTGFGSAWVRELDWAAFGEGLTTISAEDKGYDWVPSYIDGGETRYRLNEFVVSDTQRKHSKMVTPEGVVGAYGIAWWPHDKPRDESQFHEDVAIPPCDRCWEILTMQTPGPFYGLAQTSFTQASATVPVKAVHIMDTAGHITTGGYDPFLPGTYDELNVYNPPAAAAFDGTPEGGPYWFAGGSATPADSQILYCEWNMRQSRYEIRAIEPVEVAHEGLTLGVLWSS